MDRIPTKPHECVPYLGDLASAITTPKRVLAQFGIVPWAARNPGRTRARQTIKAPIATLHPRSTSGDGLNATRNEPGGRPLGERSTSPDSVLADDPRVLQGRRSPGRWL